MWWCTTVQAGSCKLTCASLQPASDSSRQWRWAHVRTIFFSAARAGRLWYMSSIATTIWSTNWKDTEGGYLLYTSTNQILNWYRMARMKQYGFVRWTLYRHWKSLKLGGSFISSNFSVQMPSWLVKVRQPMLAKSARSCSWSMSTDRSWNVQWARAMINIYWSWIATRWSASMRERLRCRRDIPLRTVSKCSRWITIPLFRACSIGFSQAKRNSMSITWKETTQLLLPWWPSILPRNSSTSLATSTPSICSPFGLSILRL